MAFFTVYIDDSGTDPSQRVAVCTCLIVPAKRILALEDEWNRLREKEGFSCFHTSEFAARNPKSDFASWDDAKRARVFTRVRQIVKKYGVKCHSFVVKKKDYDEVIPAEFRKYLSDHYSWAVYYAVRGCAQWRSTARIADPFEWVFDYMKPSDYKRKEIEQIMEMAEYKAALSGRPGEYKNFTFRERCELPGLQCVDVLAWTNYQMGLFVFEGKPYYPDAEIAAEDFDEYMDGSWMECRTVTRRHLEDFIKNELELNPALQEFTDWFKKTGKTPAAKNTKKVRRRS